MSGFRLSVSFLGICLFCFLESVYFVSSNLSILFLRIRLDFASWDLSVLFVSACICAPYGT